MLPPPPDRLVKPPLLPSPLFALAGLLLATLTSPAAKAPFPVAAPLAPPRISAAPGYEVTLVHAVARAQHGSWISLAADPRGRLYASDQYGPIYRITLADQPGGAPTITPVPLKIGGAHGLAWINGSLYAVVGQKEVCPPGLYRLRDTDGDGELDQVELLRALDGDGEHGPHAVVAAPDGQSLWVLAGNATRLPELVRSRVPRCWADDALLRPLGALMGSETRGVLPGSWICRTDLDGRAWALHAAGLRNAYSLACDPNGELFTADSDTEFELNLPWYRPTRVVHAVSGADFGWRRGALKIPDGAPDLWPTVLPLGLGSPTAVLFPAGAHLPDPERTALWVADWSYGKILALSLQASGATFSATRREIVSALPLPVTAIGVNPIDGALYFTTGGRRIHSALYRLRWTGETPGPAPPAMPPTPEAVARHALEQWHGRVDAAAVAAAWPALGSPEPNLRLAARTVLESQPVAAWRDRALHEAQPRAALAALLGLARVDAAGSRMEILAALRALRAQLSTTALLGEWLRVLSLTFSRGGGTDPATRAAWRPILEALRPDCARELAPAVLELLVYCDSPFAAEWGLALLRSGASRTTQLDLVRSLSVLTSGWNPDLRREFFKWLASTASWRGGGSFRPFLQRLRDDAVASVPPDERPGLRDLLTQPVSNLTFATFPLGAERRPVRTWTSDDVVGLVGRDTQRRDPVRGRLVFGSVGCFVCHSFDGEGSALGPDLTAVGHRLALRDLVEAIIEPSREISDPYATSLVTLRDGRQLSGRIVNLVEDGLHLASDLSDPSNVSRLANADIVAITASSVSLMPPGLLTLLSDEEILDLLAFLRRDPGRP